MRNIMMTEKEKRDCVKFFSQFNCPDDCPFDLPHDALREIGKHDHWLAYLVFNWIQGRKVAPPETAYTLWHMFLLFDFRPVGDPLPAEFPVKIYRGVNQFMGRKRKIKSPFWTLSLDIACWFALRWGDDTPGAEVLVSEANEKDVYLCSDDRGEREIWVNPYTIKKPSFLKIPKERMIRLRMKIHNERLHERGLF